MSGRKGSSLLGRFLRSRRAVRRRTVRTVFGSIPSSRAMARLAWPSPLSFWISSSRRSLRSRPRRRWSLRTQARSRAERPPPLPSGALPRGPPGPSPRAPSSSRRLVSVAAASRRCRHATQPLPLRRQARIQRRAPRLRVVLRAGSPAAPRAAPDAPRILRPAPQPHRAAPCPAGPAPRSATAADISSWLPGGNDSSRRADPGWSSPSFIASTSSGCSRSTRPIRRLTHVLCRAHSAATSVCVSPVLTSSRSTSASSSVVIDVGPSVEQQHRRPLPRLVQRSHRDRAASATPASPPPRGA